ncbi:MAG: rhomboid family intramembrane serine protease [Actinobacteria bacterium]|nr:MAG: rhomboid family intramembrane serine protease [Actinomycetota bacterium]
MSNVPPVGVPVCYRHPGRETYVRCTRCERPICPDCMNEASVGHQCPECVAEGRRTQRPARTAFGAARGAGAAGYATIALVVVNVVVLLLSVLSAKSSGTALAGGQGFGGLIGGDTPLLDRFGVLGQCQLTNGQVVPCGVASGEYHRLFTAMFLHFGVIHLLMNMWALWILGRPLEAMFGSLRFLAIYLVCGLGGNVAAYVFQPGALSAGASTAIFGLFAVLFVALRRLKLSTAGVVPIIVLNLIFTISVPGISIAGHLGGFLAGAVVGAGVAYAPQRSRTAVQTATLLATVAVLGLLTVWQTGQLAG